MGVIISLIRRLRKKKTTDEVLGGIDKEISHLETSRQKNRHLQNRVALLLVVSSVLLYTCGAVVLYQWFLPDSISQRLLCTIPFLAFPVLVVLLRRVLHFFFVTRINKIGKCVTSLKEKKKSILESVTETEKYKVAKELLEKYDPKGEYVARAVPNSDRPATPGQGELRRRHVPGQVNTPGPGSQLPGTQGTPSPQQHPGIPALQAQGFNTPAPNIQNCPILPRERTPFDKIAEYFIGDGPSYRYALICIRCKFHNGMALKDEFEFIAYRCCYCGHFNPARRKREIAPPLFDDTEDASESDSNGSLKEDGNVCEEAGSQGTTTQDEASDNPVENDDNGRNDDNGKEATEVASLQEDEEEDNTAKENETQEIENAST